MLFKKKNKKPEVIDIYSEKITEFGNLYCPGITYEEDKIDLAKVPTKYVKNMVYDGYNIHPGDKVISLEFSMCLVDDDDETIWGDVRISKYYTIESNEPQLILDMTGTRSYSRIMLVDTFPFRMTSMIYKDDNYYYFYAKSENKNGIYICVCMDFEQYLHMSHVFSNLNNRLSIEHKTFITHTFIEELRKFDRISFINKLELRKFSFALHKGIIHMILVLDVNGNVFIHSANLNIERSKARYIFIGRAASHEKYLKMHDFHKYVESIMFDNDEGTNEEAIFFTDSPIRCEYLKDPKKSNPEDIHKAYYFMQDMKSIINNEDTVMAGIMRYIQIDNPAIEALYDKIMDDIIVHDISMRK